MTGDNEHELARLDRAGRAPVPAMDRSYADRLEADLRVQHAQREPRQRLGWGVTLPQVLAGVAFALVAVIGVVGLTGGSTQEEGVSLDVQGQPDGGDGADGGVGGATTESDGDRGETAAPAVPTATATPLPTEPPTATPQPAPQVTQPPLADAPSTPEPIATPVATSLPIATAAPLATVTPPAPTVTPPQPTATATPIPTATPTVVAAEATAIPVPTATALPTSTPSPTSTPVAPQIDATCAVRVAGDAIGVVCEWEAIVGIDLSGYRLMRTRNDGPREVVAELGPAETLAVDRQVRAGDNITYRVLGLTGDVVRTESAAITIVVEG